MGRNDSDKPWPASVFVLCVGGDPMTTQQVDEPTMCEYRGEPCKPGDEREVSVTLTAPSKSGTYEASWRLCANFPERGFKKFGMRLRVKLTVSPNVDAADVQELESGGQTAEKNSGPSSIVESTEAEIIKVTPVGAVFSADEGSESESAEFQLVERD